jgi:L-gulonolactone oxidase
MRPTLAVLAFVAPFGSASSPVGIVYSDWDGAQTCQPLSFAQPTTEAAIVAEIVAAAAEGSMLKVVGAGHSFSGIQLTDGGGASASGPSGRLVSLDRYAGLVGAPVWAADGSYADVTVRAGSKLQDLNAALEGLGLAFVNLGSCAAQAMAGAVATGTHGTGKLLGSMSTQLVGLRLLDAAGEAHDVSSADADAEGQALFAAARVGLGAMGVVVELTVRCVPLFKLKETTYSLPLAELLASHDELYANNDRFQWNWLVKY